jgi:branched-chain amino acid transport system substrate-binding protein
MTNLTFESPFGKVTFRALDHQSTMGAYVGRTAVKDGKGVMVDWRYADGSDYLPSDERSRGCVPRTEGCVPETEIGSVR